MIKIAALIISLIIVSPAWAAPAYDNNTNGAYTESSPDSFSLNTVAGTNRYATACVRGYQDTITIISGYPKIAGVSMTELATSTSASGLMKTFLFGLVAPATGSPTYEIQFTGGAAESIVTTWTGIDQTTATGTAAAASSDSTSTATVDVSSAADELVVGCLTVREDETITPAMGAGQTERGTHNTGSFWWGKVSEEAGAGTVTTSYTWSSTASLDYMVIGVPLKPVPATTPKKVGVIIIE